MSHNVGTLDRWLRVALGVIVIALVFTGPKSAWGWLGLVPLLTGLAGTCPLYSILGFSTARRAA